MSTVTIPGGQPDHGTGPDAGAEPAVVIRGTLDAEETAALTAVLQAVAAQAEQHRREAAGRDGLDRTLDRRRRLGLWARPGSDSWKHAAGTS
jgi:ribosomal protein S15P/S13E